MLRGELLFCFLRSGGCIVIFCLVWRFFCYFDIFSVASTVSKDVIKEKGTPQSEVVASVTLIQAFEYLAVQ